MCFMDGGADTHIMCILQNSKRTCEVKIEGRPFIWADWETSSSRRYKRRCNRVAKVLSQTF